MKCLKQLFYKHDYWKGDWELCADAGGGTHWTPLPEPPEVES